MRCPYCKNQETGVLESRISDNGEVTVRRRRECVKCKKRFTTYERIGSIGLKVVKRNGEKQEYSREKLKNGLMKACWKRDISEEEVDQLVDEIEIKLLAKKTQLIRSSQIGRLVLSTLRRLDGVAYMRFASVYLDFDSVEDFKKVINQLEKQRS